MLLDKWFVNRLQCSHIYDCLIPFEIPCQSNNPNGDNKRLKIGIHLDIRGKIMTAWEGLSNSNFLDILFTSVIICNWSSQNHICDFGLQSPLFVFGKDQLDRFQQCKGYLHQVIVVTRTAYDVTTKWQWTWLFPSDFLAPNVVLSVSTTFGYTQEWFWFIW